MKRSDALSKITSAIINHNTLENQVDRETAMQISEIILKIQEEEGIVRPVKKVSNSETLVLNKFGQAIAKTDDSQVIEIGWEKE